MAAYEDIMEIVDGCGEDGDIESYACAMQRSINSGAGWRMEGSVGRSMMNAISAGLCMLGKQGCRDYWGNYIPSRDEVKPGTKGSPEYVAGARGDAWVQMLKDAEG